MRPTALFVLVLAAAMPAALRASERSETLVARAQVAYEAGRWDEARALFAEAAAADPRDADARFGLGLALGKLGRWDEAASAFHDAQAIDPGFEEATRGVAVATTEAAKASRRPRRPRSWGLRGAVGMQVDSNVALAPNDTEPSGAAVFRGAAYWDAWRRDASLLRLDYDVLETAQTNVDDFSFGWNGVRSTASWAPLPALWLGLQGGVDDYTLGYDAYMYEPWVGPFLHLVEGERGLTEVAYRHGWQTWQSFPFEGVRDGGTQAAGVTQLLYLGDPRRFVGVGYQYDDELPSSSAGNDYRRRSQQLLATLGLPLWWRTNLALTYVYRHDRYTEPNSFSPVGAERRDDRHELVASLRRPLASWLSLALYYDGVWNDSNIGLFQYRRDVVGAAVEVTY